MTPYLSIWVKWEVNNSISLQTILIPLGKHVTCFVRASTINVVIDFNCSKFLSASCWASSLNIFSSSDFSSIWDYS